LHVEDEINAMPLFRYSLKFEHNAQPQLRKTERSTSIVSPAARITRIAVMMLAWVSLTALACNLGASPDSAPPTLAPSTLLAVPTIGYSTPLPGMEATATLPPSTPIATTLYSMLDQVDSDRLMLHVASLENVYTRHVNSVGRTDGTGISAAYDYLSAEFDKITTASEGRLINYSPQPFTMTHAGKPTEQKNLFGVLTGSEAGAGVIVVGAHYDSRTDDLSDGNAYAPGADDNGSGVAAVLELARIMSQYQPRATVIFALFAGEEEGNWGSSAFLEDYIMPNKVDLQVMINLDTIGSWNDPQGNINDTDIRLFADPAHFPSRYAGEMIAFIADQNRTTLKVVLQDRIDREGRFGDHKAFSDRGYAAVRFIEALEDTPNREGRDFTQHVEPEYLMKSTQTVLTILVAMANGPRPPDANNIVVRDNGDGTRRLVWQPIPEASGYVVALRIKDSPVFGQVFNAPGENTAFDCECFTSERYAGLAIAAVSSDGIMGPLSPEYAMP
jgi:Zn-dependent M28 family amino/carboxypeptidase